MLRRLRLRPRRKRRVEDRASGIHCTDVADYVEKQQALRYTSAASAASSSKTAVEYHAELDIFLNSLDLTHNELESGYFYVWNEEVKVLILIEHQH